MIEQIDANTDKLVREQEYTRALSILSIDGVEQCAHVQDYPSLLSYGEDNSKEVSIESAEDFDLKSIRLFPRKINRIAWCIRSGMVAITGSILSSLNFSGAANLCTK